MSVNSELPPIDNGDLGLMNYYTNQFVLIITLKSFMN